MDLHTSQIFVHWLLIANLYKPTAKNKQSHNVGIFFLMELTAFLTYLLLQLLRFQG